MNAAAVIIPIVIVTAFMLILVGISIASKITGVHPRAYMCCIFCCKCKTYYKYDLNNVATDPYSSDVSALTNSDIVSHQIKRKDSDNDFNQASANAPSQPPTHGLPIDAQ